MQKIAHTAFMPALYTHYLIARETWKAQTDERKNALRPYLSLYFFGANGPDFCFFYPFMDRKSNLGSFLHKKGGTDVFRVLKTYALSPDMLAYALGFITHYAADVTFHPFVCQAANSFLKHSRIENALDGYFKRSAQSHADPYQKYFSQKLPPSEQKELFFLYATIAVKCGLPPLLQRAFFRAIQLFNAYMPMPNAFLGSETSDLLGGERKREGLADSLFIQAVSLSLQLCDLFIRSVKNHTPLPTEPFHKSYLTGNILPVKR